jgi:IMP dehydrogenase
MKNGKVADYMSIRVITISPEQRIEEVIKLMDDTNHDGFPVIEDKNLVGIITARDIISQDKGDLVSNAMSKEVMVTYPNTNLQDAARVMFRGGYSRLPVVDDKKRIVGIVTNTDVIRSHIERVTPGKIKKLTKSLEKIYQVRTFVRMGTVKIQDLRPTQNRIQPGEFQGREYELKCGLAEPIVVIKTGDRQILVDGHHRSLAALKLGIEEIQAYIITLSKNIQLGLEKTADKMGLKHITDIEVGEDTEKEIAEIIKAR